MRNLNKKQDCEDFCAIVRTIVFISLVVFGVSYISYNIGFNNGKIAEGCNQGTESMVICKIKDYSYKGQQFN